MDKYQIFGAWAPPGSPWSAWAKAAPFAHAPAEITAPPALATPEVSTFPRSSEKTALVVNAPGATAVEYGLALACAGYRPVPLFNACPMPRIVTNEILRSAIDADAIVSALVVGADALANNTVAADAPPAFLVDALRMTPAAPITENTFDNRSVVFASDFPSARLLRSRGITSALLVHDARLPIGNDLLQALLPWKSAGLPIRVVGLDGVAHEPDWPPAGFWGAIATRAFALFRLRRNPQGGYGAFVPESSGG